MDTAEGGRGRGWAFAGSMRAMGNLFRAHKGYLKLFYDLFHLIAFYCVILPFHDAKTNSTDTSVSFIFSQLFITEPRSNGPGYYRSSYYSECYESFYDFVFADCLELRFYVGGNGIQVILRGSFKYNYS